LWWLGLNIARDAGTYLYNAAQPWDNALSTTLVHNTVNVNGQDQMTRAGRFLWLNWAQAGEILYEGAEDGSWKRAAAGHNGYRWLGVLHQRVVTSFPDDRWMVEDTLSASGSRAEERISTYVARLHWLLPDWPWSLVQHRSHAKLELETPHGRVSLSLAWHVDQPGESPAHLQLARAGELLAGHGAVSPISGWYSPAYASKLPALSFSVELESILPLVFKSEWILV
jgi:hypothetical protein